MLNMAVSMRNHSSKMYMVIMALIVVVMLCLPALFACSPVEEDERITVMPGHWWQNELSEQQINTIEALWQSSITTEVLLENVWPEVLAELSADASSVMASEVLGMWLEQVLNWPGYSYTIWRQNPAMCFSRGKMDGLEATSFELYLGSSANETDTFSKMKGRGYAESRTYRVSLYIE